LSDGETRDILDTNLYAAILGSRYAAKSMMRNKRGGCIINVSSLLAKKGVEGTSVYAATKAGLLGEFLSHCICGLYFLRKGYSS
jgi:NAD(P)-dependent dehydrogenase (short-subunit alcohol dehydrogenase family)